MTVRKCSTCKHYEPAPIWRKGWCRNPLLYSPQQSHLVGEDDLDCDRGMGNYWEPLDAGSASAAEATASVEESVDPWDTSQIAPAAAPLVLTNRTTRADARVEGGGEMSQFSGPGRRGLPFDDDDQPGQGPEDPRGRGPAGGGERQYTYDADDRYWTDYLRIAAPVLGVILLLGLAWFWLTHLLGGNENPNTAGAKATSTVIFGPTPTPNLSVGTPKPVTTGGTSGTPTAGASLAPGAKVVIANTGGQGANLRAKPSTSAEVVSTLPDGTQLEVTGTSVTGDGYTWWPVKAGDKAGYVVQDYLKPAS